MRVLWLTCWESPWIARLISPAAAGDRADIRRCLLCGLGERRRCGTRSGRRFRPCLRRSFPIVRQRQVVTELTMTPTSRSKLIARSAIACRFAASAARSRSTRSASRRRLSSALVLNTSTALAISPTSSDRSYRPPRPPDRRPPAGPWSASAGGSGAGARGTGPRRRSRRARSGPPPRKNARLGCACRPPIAAVSVSFRTPA